MLNPFVLVFLMTVQSLAPTSQLDFRYYSVSLSVEDPRLRKGEFNQAKSWSSSALQLTGCIQFDENKNPVIIGKNGLD